MNKIIFIDIDGVLKPWKCEDDFYCPAVNALNLITDQTGADLIVSSDWRHGSDLLRLQSIFLHQGIHKEPIAKTGIFYGRTVSVFTRPHEIMETVDRLGITDFIVLDDQPLKWTPDRPLPYFLPREVKRSDMSNWFDERFYQIQDEEIGLTGEDAIQIIKKLNGNN